MSRAAEAAMAASYKQLKEDFVSGLTGGDILEIYYVTAVASVSSGPRIVAYSNHRKDRSVSLVCTTSTPVVFRVSNTSLADRRFPAQYRRNPPRVYHLRRYSSSS